MYIRIEVSEDTFHKDIKTNEREAPLLLELAIKEARAIMDSRRALDYCEKCGTGFIEGARFCFECGKRVGK